MRVVSSLADIDFSIGRITRDGRNLVVESSQGSTIATKVAVTPHDALRSVVALVTSPPFWLFLAALPFNIVFGNSVGRNTSWEERRIRTGLNKPW
ncbi:MAG: hypothetical protein WBO17_14535 [Sphingorhabdus sp.]